MISLLIFGLLAAAGVALLSFSVRAQRATGARLETVSAANRTTAILTADLAQAVVRTTRDGDGQTLPAFTGEPGTNGALLFGFVRGGWSNLDGAPRASVQRVVYQVADGALLRIAYPMLDGATPLPPTVLLDHLQRVGVRYRVRGAWSDRWVGSARNPLPDAIELRLVRDSGVETRQLFLVGTGFGARGDDAR